MAIAMIAALSAFALATDPVTVTQSSTSQSGTMNLNYEVTNTYTVSIPAEVTLNKTDSVSEVITAVYNLDPNNTLLVKVTNSTVTLTNDNDTSKEITANVTLAPVITPTDTDFGVCLIFSATTTSRLH